MQLPEPLQAAIANEMSHVESRDLPTAAARLTDSYKRGAFSGALATPADRAAYLAVRFPATYASSAKAIGYVRERLPDVSFASLLDLGAGAGAATLAGGEVWDF